jgi:hypothetical protein
LQGRKSVQIDPGRREPRDVDQLTFDGKADKRAKEEKENR